MTRFYHYITIFYYPKVCKWSEKSLLAFNLADVILAVRNKKEQEQKLKSKKK